MHLADGAVATVALPRIEYPLAPLQFRLQILRKEQVGDENQLVARQRHGDARRVSRRAADIALRLRLGVGIDVYHDRDTRVGCAHLPHLGRTKIVGERTACFPVGDQHSLFRIQNFGGLGHETHAVKDYELCLGFRGGAAQAERVALLRPL